MLKHYLINPIRTGAICSSSKKLAHAITEEIGLNEAQFICEIGPGTGAFTHAILEKKREGSYFFTIEINADIVSQFRKIFPEVSIHEKSATELSQIMELEKAPHLDTIISGLPWACFPASLQDELLESIYNALPEGGQFATFAYINPMPSAKRFRKKLMNRFKKVELSNIIWANIPPAFVYRCTK